MPAGLFRRINLDLLYAPFLERLLDVIADCQAEGRSYWATLGFRTFADQDKLFEKGRTLPGAVVTEARGGESAHNFGLAVDFAAQRLGIPAENVSIPDWTPAAYELLGKHAKLRGLVWGGDWTVLPDRPHVQWPGYVTKEELAPLRATYLARGSTTVQDNLRAVWQSLDKGG